MIKNFKFIALLFVLVFIISCTFDENLKKTNPDLYNDIVGTWYILSSDNPGEVMYTITFNDDGTITGDTASLFGYKEARWIGKVYVGHSVSSVNGVETNNGWLISKGNFSVYNLNTDNIEKSEKIFYSDNMSGLPTNNINFQYLNSIPPLNIMKIESQSTGIGEKFFVFSRNSIILGSLKAKFLEESKMLNEKKDWEKLNKKSISEHIIFIKSVRDLTLKSNAEMSLHELLDKKIFKYIQKEFKSYSKYSDKMIVYEDGTEMCKFYEFLKIPILFKNKVSGEKYNISIEKNDSIKNGFDIICHVNGKELNISLKPYKDKLVLVGLSSGYQVNPKSWEVAVSTIARAWNEYPEDLDNIDVYLLEKL